MLCIGSVVPGILELVAYSEWTGVVVGDGKVEWHVIGNWLDGWRLLSVIVDMFAEL